MWSHADSPDDTLARREAVIEQKPFNCHHSQCCLCITLELAFFDRRQAGLPEEHAFLLQEPAFGSPKSQDNSLKADEGLLMKSMVTMTPGLPLYRFASSDNPTGWFASPWWIGYSPFEVLKEYVHVEKIPLGLAARECLAILPQWSLCDRLVRASVKLPLVAWGGTPKTQRAKDKKTQRYGDRWEPERRITQLYIPGLSQKSEGGTQQIWQVALHVSGVEPIASALERARKP